MNTKFLFRMLTLVGILSVVAYAGNGGSEVNSWYTDISNALKGTWGKIIAVAFLGLTIILFKGGSILAGIFMMLVGLGVGTIPDIVNAKYTAIMMENDYINLSSYIYEKINNLMYLLD